MRLTRKEKSFDFDDNNEIYYFDEYIFPDHSKVCDAIDKLGQLEDMEEELGIDLITLFKLFPKTLKSLATLYKDHKEMFDNSWIDENMLKDLLKMALEKEVLL